MELPMEVAGDLTTGLITYNMTKPLLSYNNASSNTNECTNAHHSQDSDGLFAKSTEAYVVPIVFSVIFVVGIIGNGTTIFIVLRNKTMRNVPNIFIVSLATGDLLLLLVSVPFTATIYTFKEWPYGSVMCKLNECLQTLSLGISVFTLTVLSWDRYNAIARPMQQATGNPLRRTCITAVVVWCVSFGLAMIDAFGAHIRVYDQPCSHKLYICETHPEAWGDKYVSFHTIFRFLVYFAQPMIFICIFYILMARALILSSKHMLSGGQTNTSARKQIEARKKVARVVLSFVTVFAICWLPRHIFLFWYVFDPSQFNMFWHVFKIMSFCLCFINSCMNPLALYFLSRQFRGYFHQYIFCCRNPLPRKSVNKNARCSIDTDGNKIQKGGLHPGYDGYTSLTAASNRQIPVHNDNNCVYTDTTTRMISSSGCNTSPQTRVTQINMYDLKK